MAKDLVRTKAAVQKFYKMKAQLQAVSIRIQTMQSTNTMAEAMKGAVRAMVRMNKGMNIPALQKIMMEFEKQGESKKKIFFFFKLTVKIFYKSHGYEARNDG